MKNYRPDIDGLRAFAVLPVVLYHAGLPTLSGGYAYVSGGYVGVDIFFVISGFLISRIVIDASLANKFSYAEFYQRRARRLLPALFAVIAVAICAGYVLLMPEDYEEFFYSTAYALLFSSNFFFLENVNYFGQNAEVMPLLHTWSLAVEEQFYLVWPFVLTLYVAIQRRYSQQRSWAFLAAILLVSLSAAILLLDTYPDATFYMIPFRLWELALGAAIAIAAKSWPRISGWFVQPLYLTGLVLCAASIYFLDQESPFPGLTAIPVCVGTGLLLLFGDSPRNSLSAMFRWRPLVFIGQISYSLYLWHWVVLAYYRVYQNEVALSPSEAAFV